VGPGIFGGRVERHANGSVVIGRQYDDYNPLPGPVYAGGGYTELNAAIRAADHDAVRAMLQAEPSLADEISTGGARPLHVCGMSARAQHAAPLLVEAGAQLEPRDMWGYTPLQRMATNNLAVGADALVRAGASHLSPSGTEGTGDNARELARRLRSYDVLRVFQRYEAECGIPWPDGEPAL
jgi:ankyrin repeat protein